MEKIKLILLGVLIVASVAGVLAFKAEVTILYCDPTKRPCNNLNNEGYTYAFGGAAYTQTFL
jgi:hypothetical protein